mgnify:CR=1 FL=1
MIFIEINKNREPKIKMLSGGWLGESDRSYFEEQTKKIEIPMIDYNRYMELTLLQASYLCLKRGLSIEDAVKLFTEQYNNAKSIQEKDMNERKVLSQEVNLLTQKK